MNNVLYMHTAVEQRRARREQQAAARRSLRNAVDVDTAQTPAPDAA